MAKPFIGFGLVRSLYGDFRVLGITSRQHRQVYGRTLDGDEMTRVAERDLVYEFPPGTSPEFAQSAVRRAKQAADAWKGRVREADAAASETRHMRDLAVLDAAKGLGLHGAAGE